MPHLTILLKTSSCLRKGGFFEDVLISPRGMALFFRGVAKRVIVRRTGTDGPRSSIYSTKGEMTRP